MVLGTGATLPRDAIPTDAPSKPPRAGSIRKHHAVDKNETESENQDRATNDHQSELLDEASTTTVPEGPSTEATVEAAATKEEDGVPEIKFTDSLGPMPGIIDGSVSQGSENPLPVVSESGGAVANSPESGTEQGHDDKQQTVNEQDESTKPSATSKENSTENATTTTDQTHGSDSNSDSDSNPKVPELKSDTSMERQSTQRSSFSMTTTRRMEDTLFETAQLLGKVGHIKCTCSCLLYFSSSHYSVTHRSC